MDKDYFLLLDLTCEIFNILGKTQKLSATQLTREQFAELCALGHWMYPGIEGYMLWGRG